MAVVVGGKRGGERKIGVVVGGEMVGEEGGERSWGGGREEGGKERARESW